MSTIHPDEAAARGLVRPERPEAAEGTIDGTIVDDPAAHPPLVLGDRDFHSITETICSWVEKKPPRLWLPLFGLSSAVAGVGTLAIFYLIVTGVGVWGLNNPVMWGWAIVNFVWWVGIGHAGTLISAILCVFKQQWRTSINRFAEAMTIFAVICAGTFPGIHVGRIWFAWFLFPLPNSNAIWQNFRSPLLWDVFAVGTYFTISLLFWYMGMIPDLATLRDRAMLRLRQGVSSTPVQKTIDYARAMTYGLLAMGWRFNMRAWRNYEKAYILLAGIATPLVLSVHSVVSFDFAVSILPGWHTTIFPPYFVAGAIFSGFAMVLTLLIPARELYPGLKDFVTAKTMENMCKIITLTGSMVGFAYIMEFFIAWYGANPYEQEAFMIRAFGPYWWAYFAMFFCNVVSPQVFWSKWARTTPWFIFIVTIFVNIGMWFERFVIVSTLSTDFLPANWDYYTPTWVDVTTFIGTLGIFGSLFLLFMRLLPMLAISEIKNVTPAAHAHLHGHGDKHATAHAGAAAEIHDEEKPHG